MKQRIRELVRRIVPVNLRRTLRAKRSALRPPTMTTGVGQGLRFDPGPSNPQYATGDNEIPVQEALADVVGLGDVVFDIGANVGFFSIVSARLTGPTGRVIAFEPVPANADLVRRNAALNGFENISVVEKAVSDAPGRGELVLAQYSGGAALSITTAPPDAAGTIVVDVITIDGSIGAAEIPVPDVVKIDVEGVELEVLRGMDETMSRERPIVICEIDDGTQAGYERKHAACVDHLTALGYEIVQLEDSYAGGDWIVGHFVARHPAKSRPR